MIAKKKPALKGAGAERHQMMDALGLLPEGAKVSFIDAAVAWLSSIARLEAAGPTPDDRAALDQVASHADALQRALEQCNDLALPRAYLVNAWQELASSGSVPTRLTVEDLRSLLPAVSAAARLWIGPARKKGRPIPYATRAAIHGLAGHYLKTFGEAPGTGTESRFVQFCAVAFPACGLEAPSRGLIASLLARNTTGH